MKILKIFLAIVAALVLAVMIFAMTLPSDISIEREVKINVPQSFAYEYLLDIKNWEQWTVWKEFDSTLVYTYTQNTIGKGAKQNWDGEHSEAASLIFTDVAPPKKIDFKLAWNNDETSFSGYIRTNRIDENTTDIKWVHYKDVGWNPFMRILGSMLEGVMGPNFEKSLNNLKKKLEHKYNVENKTITISSN